MTTRRRTLSPSLVISLLALVFATAGTSAAATRLITGSEIAPATITAHNIRRSSLTADRLSRGVRLLLRARAAPAGAEELRTQLVTAAVDLPDDGSRTSAVASCPQGTIAVGGSALVIDTTNSPDVRPTPDGGSGAPVAPPIPTDSNFPAADDSGWTGSAHTTLPGHGVMVAAICASGTARTG